MQGKLALIAEIYFQNPRWLLSSLHSRAGVPAELVSAKLGHHSVAFTLQTYRTLLKGEQVQHARPLEDLLTPRTRPEA